MSRPPGRAAAGLLLISLVTLEVTAQQAPAPTSLPNQYSPDKRIPQWTDLGLAAACGVLMLILLSLVRRPASETRVLYAAGGHSAELDYTGPELAHSAELDYNGSHEMV